ncbi:peroxisomal membrane protein PMP34 [Ischnura elegans]|uniref:peroxisomal membrane protein PMP34 n=1 Tax=Ischnura elegans TaxID=197161 RepID=UPI001ED8A215|nr:peroxisomal membrane protein PMP34 [Ischnura elegans]
MKTDKKLFSYETLAHAAAGAAGSVVGMTTFFPLDTVRSRLQLEDHREAKNTVAVIKDLVQEEGFATLYRGLVPVLNSLCASNFVYFYAFHGLRHSLGSGPRGASAEKDLLLASVAGVINVLTTTPLWVVNTRLKMQGIQSHNEERVPVNREKFDGLIDGLMKVYGRGGIPALWAGTVPSLILVSNPAIQFAAYEALKRHLLNPPGASGRLEQPSALVAFLLGAIAKAVATLITYPIQLIQTRLRHGHNLEGLKRDAGMFDMMIYILRRQGFKGLYKGMEAKILQTVLTAALMFATYEKIVAFVLHLLLRNKPAPLKH